MVRSDGSQVAPTRYLGIWCSPDVFPYLIYITIYNPWLNNWVFGPSVMKSMDPLKPKMYFKVFIVQMNPDLN